MSEPARRLVDAGEVARMLNARIGALVHELLPDGTRNGAEWCARNPGTGKIGSFNVHLTGEKAGVWGDFVAGVWGDALDLIAYVRFGDDKKDAFAWALRWLGIDNRDPAAIARVQRETPTAPERDAQAELETERLRNAAFRIWLSAMPNLRDTPVDMYLQGRGIALADLKRAPRAIRFHPGLYHKASDRRWPAMVTLVAGANNQAAGCHRTWLECRNDGRVTKAPVEKNKMVLGSYKGGSVHLWRGASGKPLSEAPESEIADITEGIEDGLSVAIAAPECRVLAAIALSNMANIVLPDAIHTVRLWRQNDTSAPAIDAFMRAARVHALAGREVLIPPIPADLKDVNDLLRSA